MANPIHIVLLLMLVVGWVAFAYLVARFAERKGRSYVSFLIGGLLINPVAALLAALILPARARRDAHAPPA